MQRMNPEYFVADPAYRSVAAEALLREEPDEEYEEEEHEEKHDGDEEDDDGRGLLGAAAQGLHVQFPIPVQWSPLDFLLI